MSKLIGPEGNANLSSDPSKHDTTNLLIRQVANQVLSTPFGRGILAVSIGVGSLGAVTGIEAQPNNANEPCVKVGFSPDTIINNGNDFTSLEVEVLAACRPGLLRVEAKFDSDFTIDNEPTRLDGRRYIHLKDDGIGSDKIAGDWVFTSGKIRTKPHYPLTPHEGINDLMKYTPGGMQLIYSDGSTRMQTGVDLFVVSETANIFKPSLRSFSVQTTPHVINMSDEFSPVAQVLRGINGEQDMRGLVNKLYGLAPGTDPYNFLIMTNNRQIYVTPDSPPANGIAGTARTLRSDFSGTGRQGYSDTDVVQLFGSQGNLRQLIFAREPLDALTALHELDHYVAAYLRLLLGLTTNDGHWKDNNSAGGLVGGNTWINNPDGTFTSKGYAWQYLKMSKLEQYLWGFIRADQMPPINIALDENQTFWQNGTNIHGPFKVVTAQDIIAIHGPRTPGPEASLRDLKMGYVFTTTGRLATPVEMTARELLAQRLPKLWFEATDGLSTMEFVIPKEVPSLIEPYAGRTMDGLGNRIKFRPLPGTKHAQWQIIPSNNDGPGLNLVIGDSNMIQKGEFRISSPVLGTGPYVMLPGQGYVERVRLSDKDNPDPNRDEDWSGWGVDTFRTPIPDAATIEPVIPNGARVESLNPTLPWKDRNTQMFYYEVQVSKDPTFNTDPKTATAAVYWVLQHGGVTNPYNSFSIPTEYPLEPGSKVYYRIRQRVQGDGKPVDWSQVWNVDVSPTARIQTFSQDLVDKDYGNGVIGPSQEQYKLANPQPPVLPESSLARVISLQNGLLFIP